MALTKHSIIQLIKDCALALQTPVMLINHHYKMEYCFPDSFHKPPKVLRNIHTEYIEESRKLPYTLQLFSDPYDQHIFLYPIQNRQGKELVIGIGPFLQYQISRKQVKTNLVINRMDPSFEEPFMEYFEQLPIMNQVRISAVERLLTQLLPKQEKQMEYDSAQDPHLQLPYQEYSQSSRAYPELVASKDIFTQLFKQGDDQALEVYQSYKEKLSLSKQGKAGVRAEKNQLIRLITEMGYLCIEAGAYSGEVLSLSDFYIDFLETRDSIEDLKMLELNILQSFLERIKRLNHLPQHSPLIERSQRYIFQNLTKNLTLKGIAEVLHINPNYLSGIFTKEVGMSMTNFINQQRIKEAKELLTITDYSLMEISMLLGYNSQSYFTRVFKSVEGIGPKEFRKKYHVYEE